AREQPGDEEGVVQIVVGGGPDRDLEAGGVQGAGILPRLPAFRIVLVRDGWVGDRARPDLGIDDYTRNVLAPAGELIAERVEAGRIDEQEAEVELVGQGQRGTDVGGAGRRDADVAALPEVLGHCREGAIVFARPLGWLAVARRGPERRPQPGHGTAEAGGEL